MKYNRYLIVGITLLTILLLFLFTGAVSQTETELFGLDGLDSYQHGYSTLLLGIGLPLVLAILYLFTSTKKSKSQEK
ncbi:hypothetical protein RE476_06400 [Methanolobus mangrovi]|uniref:Uncharacterized protein n=1 Tax=Methanolobus mangrovi TaxID=3072977 RepID=A0AA51YFM8_9EURY|nr:hypothetical protein [Methanolobus mangrovi]WMW21047.1 hypothetical protein RE476_06400 [Methanolobus mangrovi]